jgi:hypothetical protein
VRASAVDGESSVISSGSLQVTRICDDAFP